MSRQWNGEFGDAVFRANREFQSGRRAVTDFQAPPQVLQANSGSGAAVVPGAAAVLYGNTELPAAARGFDPDVAKAGLLRHAVPDGVLHQRLNREHRNGHRQGVLLHLDRHLQPAAEAALLHSRYWRTICISCDSGTKVFSDCRK